MPKTSNRNARKLIQGLIPFSANNVFAENAGALYVVYSYGHHFPMYVFNRNSKEWIKNSDKYSVTTSKHQSQCNPCCEIAHEMQTSELKDYIASFYK